MDPAQATRGGFAGLTFHVPNESGTALMTQVRVQLPEATPTGEVYPYSVPGWAPKVTMRGLDQPFEAIPGVPVNQVASDITWIAVAGAEPKPGEVAELSFSINPVPEADQLVFAVVEIYSDGTTVRWADTQAGAGEAPGHAAPVVKLVTPAASQAGTAGAPDGGQHVGTQVSAGNALRATPTNAVLLLLLACLLGGLIMWVRAARAAPVPPGSAPAAGLDAPARSAVVPDGTGNTDTSGTPP